MKLPRQEPLEIEADTGEGSRGKENNLPGLGDVSHVERENLSSIQVTWEPGRHSLNTITDSLKGRGEE